MQGWFQIIKKDEKEKVFGVRSGKANPKTIYVRLRKEQKQHLDCRFKIRYEINERCHIKIDFLRQVTGKIAANQLVFGEIEAITRNDMHELSKKIGWIEGGFWGAEADKSKIRGSAYSITAFCTAN